MHVDLIQDFGNKGSISRIFAARKLAAGLQSAIRNPQSAICLLVLFALAFSTLTLSAQSKRPIQPPSNRFLIIVDTSASMKKHLADITNVVSDLILNGASGQMHSGDSLGFWTFNQDVSSDLPAQSWTGDDRGILAARTVNYLQHQRFTKSSRLDKALDDMQQVIHASDIITVFIISTGEDKMAGTPFDVDINAQYKQALKDMKRARRPVVTVLQAKGGKLIRYTVNALPWPIIVPEVPIPILAAQPPPRTNEVPPAPKPAPANPPPQNLILSGPSVASNAPTQSTAPPIVPVPTPSAAVPEVKVETPATTAAAAQSNITAKPPQVTPSILPAPPTVNLPPPPPIPTASTNVAQPQPVEITAPAQATAPKPIAPPVANDSVPPAPAQSNSTAAPPPLPANPVHIATTTTSSSNMNTWTASNNVSAHAMAFVAPDTGGRSKFLLIGGLILVLVAAGLIALMVRRSRTTSGPSLITHSMGNTGRKR